MLSPEQKRAKLETDYAYAGVELKRREAELAISRAARERADEEVARLIDILKVAEDGMHVAWDARQRMIKESLKMDAGSPGSVLSKHVMMLLDDILGVEFPDNIPYPTEGWTPSDRVTDDDHR